jgi:hypothetical protein
MEGIHSHFAEKSLVLIQASRSQAKGMADRLHVYILPNGGLQAWMAADNPVENGTPQVGREYLVIIECATQSGWHIILDQGN